MQILRVLIRLTLLSCLCFQTACFDGKQDASVVQILRKGNGADPQTLDPQLSTGLSESKIHQALFEGLINIHPETAEPIPGVAKSWNASKDATRYTFHLRDNARWSDGAPVTAEDFIQSYKRILSPALGSPHASMLFVLKNAKAFNAGDLEDFSEVGVHAEDPRTLVFEFENPTPHFLSLIMHHAWFPVPTQSIEQSGDLTDPLNPWTRPGNIVSNGAFQLKDWRVGELVCVEANPHYWDASSVHLDGIEFYAFKENGEERAFWAGQLDVTETVPSAKIPNYLSAQTPEFKTDTFLGTYSYILNTEHAPLDDPSVRKALNLALNRESLINNVLRGGQAPAYSFVPDGVGAYEPKAQLYEDLAEAQQLLAEAGFPNGENFPVLTLLYAGSANDKLLAEAVQHMFADTLGIQLELVQKEWKVYLTDRKAGNFDLMRFSWIGDYVDPTTFLDMFRKDAGNNYSRWSSEAYETAMQEAEKAGSDRLECLAEAEWLMLSDAPIVPIYFYNNKYLIAPEVKGWPSNILGLSSYNNVSIER